MAAPFRVKALFEYTSPHDDDLNFSIGQVITVTDEEDVEWYGGEYVDDNGVKQEGIFPRNFVEKFEPTPPPRPTRTRTKKADDAPTQQQQPEPAQPTPTPAAVASPSSAVATTPISKDEPEPEPEPAVEQPKLSEPRSPSVPAPVPAPAAAAVLPKASPANTEQSTKPAPREVQAAVPAPAPKSKPSGPPPVSEKPISSSFKDRIAAFNKPAAAPVAPFKPTGLGGSSFIKKPFVPPPPSRDAYVPIPREQATQKIYRRSEDPEIREQEAQNQEHAEKAGLLPNEVKQDIGDEEEDQPKPTSLKERIALLAKQQQEQAQRHADAAAKKEKPKKPAKKKPDVPAGEPAEDVAEADLAPLERRDTETTIGRTSLEEQAPAQLPQPPRRKVSRGPAAEFPRDGNEADMSGAGDTTEGQDDTSERDDDDDESKRRATDAAPTSPTMSRAPTARDDRHAVGEPQGEEKQEEGPEEEQEEEDDVDPEVRRKEELRARMAKMSGGMGFHGMFGAPMPPVGGLPKRSKPEKAPKEDIESHADDAHRSAPPVPAPTALPGLGGLSKSQEREHEHEDDRKPAASLPSPPPVPSRVPTIPEPDDADGEQGESDDNATPGPASRSEASRAPPVSGNRPAPPPVPSEREQPYRQRPQFSTNLSLAPRPPVATPTPAIKSATEGSESDDELSGGKEHADAGLAQSPRLPVRSPPLSPRFEEPPSANKRNSRPPPPIPSVASLLPPAAGRPPPPPPPGGLSRQSTADVPPITPSRPVPAGDEPGEESTEYEGDYDTDIASSVPHKDALKAHARDSSVDDSLLQSPTTEVPQSRPPPVPPTSPPRALPPPVPAIAPPENKRRSVDAPRAAPPPPPPPATAPSSDDYDPFNYTSPTIAGGSSRTPKIEEEAYSADVASSPVATPTAERHLPLPIGARTGGRQSMEGTRTSTSNRRSMDLHRQSLESGFIANDVDLSIQSGWWKQANQLPPVLQGRRDIFFESEETTTNNQGSKTVVTREIFILYQDYSQTVLTVRFNPYDPADVELDQKHEGPPRTLRQDEMEDFHDRFGRQIVEAAATKKDSVVGDGSPQGLVLELLRPLKGALWPVGSRAYGALVYSNMANASTQQHDIIRPGDIVSFRNSKFQGKHGAMHAKYSAEVGKPDHVAIVAEWDGTKKKLRAWEQGRENKKVKLESYKLDDLRSGEVKVWRVVARNWVGWNSQP
ncbi:SH3 domain-containing protein [Beauveria bassiana ARSEF 2860]|uniref:SH3 domain-containing protein n=1 Tax=Beauveria bassiana (strain ARSEF 2860) TaxID=655819 RepID=J4UIJ2_BEAB2|nr:SH3 domain-containing protein [Beauveria bassiana ARSEF 2860]EJP63382.1 SH3 domain-containing protein [Beauveria bassiana ARSEF 2860]